MTNNQTDNAQQKTVRFDEGTGITHVMVNGFWSIGDANGHFDNLTKLIDRLRGERRKIRVLADRRGNQARSTNVVQRMQRAHAELYRPEDRFAVAVDSVLAKMQLQHIFSYGGSRAFANYGEALAWLRE